MGLIRNIVATVGSSISTVAADQYVEFFTCDSLGQDVLVRQGAARMQKGNNKGSVDVISNGSKIAVPEGTALILVDNGKVVDFTCEAGLYTWDTSSAPSVFAGQGGFMDNMKSLVTETWNRMKAGGEISTQQRIYFVNMLEIRDQKFGTPTAQVYPDPEYRKIYVRLNGVFSFKVVDPVTFFKTQCSSVVGEYKVGQFMGTPASPMQPRLEFLDRVAEMLNKCGSIDKISFAELPSHQGKIREYMQDALDQEWLQNRGVVVSTVAISGITPDDKSRERIEKIDEAKMYGEDQNALAAQAILGQTEAMKLAGGNANGAVNGLMGLGMMGGMGAGGGMGQAAFGMLQQNQQAQMQQAAPMAAAPAQAAGWTCSCGQAGNQGKFCMNCGQPQPAPAPAGWTCSCGQAGNTGKFCMNCGQPQPAAEWTCSCGQAGNKGKFCMNCGKPQA